MTEKEINEMSNDSKLLHIARQLMVCDDPEQLRKLDAEATRIAADSIVEDCGLAEAIIHCQAGLSVLLTTLEVGCTEANVRQGVATYSELLIELQRRLS